MTNDDYSEDQDQLERDTESKNVNDDDYSDDKFDDAPKSNQVTDSQIEEYSEDQIGEETDVTNKVKMNASIEFEKEEQEE